MRAVVIASFVLLAQLGAWAEESEKSIPPEQRGAAVVAAFNSGDDDVIAQMVRENWSGAVSDQQRVAKVVSALRRIHDERGDMLDPRFEIVGDGAALFIIARQAANDAWANFQFQVDRKDGNRLTLIFIGVTSPPSALPEADVQSGEFGAWLAGRIRELDATQPFHGVISVSHGEQALFEIPNGYADAEAKIPVSIDSRFNTASGAKMFTAIAIGQLVEARKLSFDDPVVNLLPELAAAGLSPEVTVRHLLSHTSGIGEYWDDEYRKSWDGITSNAQMLPHVLRNMEGGSVGEFAYSNSNFVLAALILERNSGESFYDLLREKIFEPAGMEATGYPVVLEGDYPPSIARPYEAIYSTGALELGTFEPAKLGPRGTGAGGAYTTAADMRRFVRAFESGILVSDAMRQQLLMPQADMDEDGRERYGLGFILNYDQGHLVSYGHGGMGPGAHFTFERYPSADLTVIVMSNYDTVAAYDLSVVIDKVIRRN